MSAIEPPDSHYLSAAMGWLGLGDCEEAIAELKNVTQQSHPEVLQVRYEICGKQGKWDQAVEIAETLRQLLPADEGAWIGLAYALRRKQGGGIPAAREILTEAWNRFPHAPIVAYNLACYECQLGALDDARQWLEKAYRTGSRSALKKMALNDPDLKLLWPEIQTDGKQSC